MSVVGVIVLCRYSSSRLPGKILLPFAGDTILGQIVERIRKTDLPFVIATSSEESDNPIEEYCMSRGLPIFRGDLNNVSLRFLECAEEQEWKYAVRINGDNVFVDPGTLSFLANEALRDQAEFLTNVPGRTFPPGSSIEIVNVSSYRALSANFDTDRYREHVTLYIYENPGCCTQYTHLNPNAQEMAGLNIAIDTLMDYDRAQAVVNILPTPISDRSLGEIVRAYKKLETPARTLGL